MKEVEASLLDAAERHVTAAATAAVLRWLIGKHRAASQGPLIARAGSLFRGMTRESFAGLGLDYGDDDQPRIVGLRPSGERVGVEGMSEGTRDQLYLALRLASIDERSAGECPSSVMISLLLRMSRGRRQCSPRSVTSQRGPKC